MKNIPKTLFLKQKLSSFLEMCLKHLHEMVCAWLMQSVLYGYFTSLLAFSVSAREMVMLSIRSFQIMIMDTVKVMNDKYFKEKVKISKNVSQLVNLEKFMAIRDFLLANYTWTIVEKERKVFEAQKFIEHTEEEGTKSLHDKDEVEDAIQKEPSLVDNKPEKKDNNMLERLNKLLILTLICLFIFLALVM